MKKKVLHILNSSSFSGAENVVITIIRTLKEEFDFAYVSPRGTIQNVLEKEKIPFEPIEKLSFSEIRRVVKKLRPDIIHAHDFRASVICALANTQVPIISHLHNNSPWLKKRGLYSYLYFFCSSSFSKILMVSDSILKEYVFGNEISQKSEIISNPVDTLSIRQKAQLQLDTTGYDIVFIGRLSLQKNPLRFIEIANQLVKKDSKIVAAMIGSGELEGVCRDRIQKLHLGKKIILTGFIENPYSVLAKSKILCMTSDWEGYGLVAIEALSLGIPVVATPVGGLTGIVDETCGKLCKENAEFVREMHDLLTNEKIYSEKSTAALQRAKDLDNLTAYNNQLIDIYFEFAQKH